jgi:hypothetical protein
MFSGVPVPLCFTGEVDSQGDIAAQVMFVEDILGLTTR